MKKICLYECDICKTRFPTENKAKECEETHKKLLFILEQKYHCLASYPDKLTIQFNNGMSVDYVKSDKKGEKL